MSSAGARLRLARERAGLTQSEAASRRVPAITQGAWAIIESGSRSRRPVAEDWAAVGCDGDGNPTGEPAAAPPRRGRPPAAALGPLTAAEVAAAIYGRATVSQSRAVGIALAGITDLGIARLDALLTARPELDARETIAELARRMRERKARG